MIHLLRDYDYKMGNYRLEKISKFKTKYLEDIPKSKKSSSFYYRNENNLYSSVLLVQPDNAPTLTLMCPIARTRQVVPVRTQMCEHVETFDLFNLLESLSVNDIIIIRRFLMPGKRNSPSTVSHTCPMCRVKAPLYIDTIISSALASISPEITTVEISPTGSLLPYTAVTTQHEVVDLVSPFPSPAVSNSSLDTPHLRKEAGQHGNRRRFSFGDR